MRSKCSISTIKPSPKILQESIFRLILIGMLIYFGTNVKGGGKPKIEKLLEAFNRTAKTHFQANDSHHSAVSLVESSSSPAETKEAIEALKSSITTILNSIDKMTAQYADSVGPYDHVTSNIMVFVMEERVNKRRCPKFLETMQQGDMYPDELIDPKDSIGWLCIAAESSNSSQKLNVVGRTLRLHSTHKHAAPGAGDAFYEGQRFLANNEDAPAIVSVNDVNEIAFKFDSETSNRFRELCRHHFEKYAEIKSFVSVPLILNGEVIGVLNVNSSGYYLGGLTTRQHAIIEAIVYPSITALACLLIRLRDYDYGY